MKKTLTGLRFGRLVVVAEAGKCNDGCFKWRCLCDCGNSTHASTANLNAGKVKSCGCYAREQSSTRAKELFTKPKQKCSVDWCFEDTSKGGNGYCGKHAQRVRRYGDHQFVTTEQKRRESNRASQLENVEHVKPTTYRKFLGKHEHRVVAEKKIGRSILPGEHVHHIDGNKHNNSPENLLVMSAEDHSRLHAMEKKNAA